MKFFAIFQSFREGGFIRSFFLGARRTNPEGLPFLLTPPSFGHLPCVLHSKTQGRRVRVTLRLLQCDAPHTGHGRGRRVVPASEMKSGIGLFSLPFCSTPQCYGVGERLKRFFCSLSKGGVLLPLLVFLIPLLVATLLSSPLYFALQNAGEEGNTSFRNEVGYRSFFFAVLQYPVVLRGRGEVKAVLLQFKQVWGIIWLSR